MRIEANQKPVPRRGTPRLTLALALFAISAALFCALAGYALVRQADERWTIERRMALQSAISDLRQTGQTVTAPDAEAIRILERAAALKELRFESEPAADSREVQSVLDGNGRIIGWFSWAADRAMSDALATLQPLLIAIGLCFIGFAAVSLWQVRRAVRDLGTSEWVAWSLAHEDALTGLPNHRRMLDLIDQALARRQLNEVVMLALIDLDGLGDINGGHGRDIGDRLLTEWSARLRVALPPEAAGGRFHGDEFALVLSASSVGEAEDVLRTIAQAVSRPFWIEQQVVQINATVGFAHTSAGPADRDALIRAAALALRNGKRRARGAITAYDAAMDGEFNDRRFLERELKRALAERTLDVHYQPIVTADGSRIAGVEALVRWTHLTRGSIPPIEFVAVAEQAGLIGELGEFVLRRVLADAARWPELSVAVNLSPVQVRDPHLVDVVASILAETEIAAERLILEVTEGVLVDDPMTANARLNALRALGVKLALDDFGTGYSSLSYLQKFRFDKLKIDRSFVAPLGRTGDGQAMIQAIVSLGRALGLSLLAEGVETEVQRVLLRLAGCDELQGYLFARPGPREAIDTMMVEARAAVPDGRRAAVRAS